MAVADHFIEADRLGAVGERGEEAARLDLAELGGVADQDQLRLGCLGVVDQAGQVGRVDHPGLVDQQDGARAAVADLPAARRGRARRGASRRWSPSSPSERRTFGRPPGRRRRAQLDAGGAQPSAAAVVA